MCLSRGCETSRKSFSKAYLATSAALGAIALTVDGQVAVRDAILGAFLHQQRPVQLLCNLLHLILPAFKDGRCLMLGTKLYNHGCFC